MLSKDIRKVSNCPDWNPAILDDSSGISLKKGSCAEEVSCHEYECPEAASPDIPAHASLPPSSAVCTRSTPSTPSIPSTPPNRGRRHEAQPSQFNNGAKQKTTRQINKHKKKSKFN